jgi:hypothetical protein
LRHGININLTPYLLLDYRRLVLCLLQCDIFFEGEITYIAPAYHEHRYTGELDLGELVCSSKVILECGSMLIASLMS